MNHSHIIQFEKVNFSYETQQVLHDLSFTVDQGEFICLTGKSGCGKSTLLRLINGLLERQDGEVNILDKNIDTWEIHQLRRNMGYVLQEGSLFPHLTAYQNMCYTMKLKRYDDDKIEHR